MPSEDPRPTILIVEDDRDTRLAVAFALEQAGYRVEEAADGQAALGALRSGSPPGLILLDMMLPVLDGWHFLQRLRAGGALPPILVTTATTLTRGWAEDHGCAGFLRKPVEAEDLLAEVRRCLG
jgi:CheY-like chemotaxis protein